MFTAFLLSKDEILINIDKIDDIEQRAHVDRVPASGVFSTVRGNGQLDEASAREWIKANLGLTNAQIIVTNAIMKGMTDEDVFGVTDIAVDALDGVINGIFMLSRHAGRGVHYHEAFHYVNLLLHTKQQRNQIYEAYVAQHPELKNKRKKEIEELLAEEFREYCELLDDKEARINQYKGVRRWLARLMNKFVEFVKTWTRRDLISKMFNDIRSAKYVDKQLDAESVEEFKKAYPKGAYDANFTASGATKEQLDKLKSINTYQQFYSVAETVAHYFLDFANVKHVNNVANVNRKTFEKFMLKLKRDNLIQRNLYLQDVIDNPEAFISTINSIFKQYGIVGKRKKVREAKQPDGDINSQEKQAENEISQLANLYDNYTIDHKANTAFRAKLFLSQVKDSKFVYDEQLKQNVVVQKKDPITGLPLFVTFDDAWHKITEQLYQVDSFEELMKTVERLSKTKAFFAELYKNLRSIGNDTELQTQIYNTVNKHLTKVAQIRIEGKKKRKTTSADDDLTVMSDDEGSVSDVVFKEYDQDKKFSILNDNALKAKRMLPRDWSKDLFSSPVITYDTYHHINRDYVKNVLQKELTEIKSIVRGNEKLNTGEKQHAFDEAFPRLLSLIQKMAIPFDEDVLTEYLMLHVKSKIQDPRRKKNPDSNDVGIDELYDALKEVIADPGSSKNKSANISFFINTVFQSDKTSQVKVGKRKVAGLNIPGYSTAKNLDELYSSFSSGSEIEKMAIAYNNIHPSSRELSITGPGGKLIYPIGENNFISDTIRWINKNYDGIIKKMQATPYAQHSKILETANTALLEGSLGNFEFKLNVFSGMEDEKSKKGVDYFGVNSLEDVISKMFFTDNNMLILPTMADKKTYYAIEFTSRKGDDAKGRFQLPHDILISQRSDDLPEVDAKRFSNATIETFIGYFMDELESLTQYYKKENVAAVIKNKNVRKKNFHGKVKDGRMDFSGNGGKFRYFYGLAYKGSRDENLGELNLNQILEYEYNRQKLEEDPAYGDGTWKFREDSGELDGFETVRQRLEDIKEYYFGNIEGGKLANRRLYDDINKMLMSRVYDNLREFSKPGENQLISYKYYKDASDPNAVGEWRFVNRAIPTQLISEYVDIFRKHGRDDMYFTPNTAYSISNRGEDLVLSVMGNYVAQSMISTIEVEKVLSGDPAFYKWAYAKTTTSKEINGQVYEFSDLIDKDTDKIKRLGALLSPGSELRTDFSEEEYAKYPWLRGRKYINATIHDVNASSIYADEIKNVFTIQLLADNLRKANVEKSIINAVYNDESVFKAQMEKLSQKERDEIYSQAEAQANPYVDGNITVSDAQVMIRPDMYRKIRMMLGQWSVDPVKITYKNYTGQTLETYYSDNEAFEILENDPEWMVDPEKAAKVSRLQLYPLKMTYFKNDPREIAPDYTIAHGLYNKMAIFPAFKYLMRSTTGKKLYDRMNRKSDPLDMLTFESAVKVGLGADIYSPTDKKANDLSKLNEQLELKSACTLENDVENWAEDTENTLNVEVQDLRGIRMQLNTEAHTDEERTIGT